MGCTDAAGRVLNDDAFGRRKAETGRACQINFGVRLGIFDVGAGHKLVEQGFLRADGGQIHEHLDAVCRRADSQPVAPRAQRVQHVQNAIGDIGFLLHVLAVARIEVVLHLRAVRHAVFFCHAADIAVLAAADKLGEVGFLRVNAVFLQRTDAGFRHVFLGIDQHAVHIE